MWHAHRTATSLGDHLTAERIERVPLLGGIPGTDQTIEVMARAAMGEYGAGSGKIRNLALDIIHAARVAERDRMGEVIAIHNWVMKHLRYVKDPVWYEFVTYPETLAFDRADGDCDDHVVLEAALLGSLGTPSRFVVYGFKNQPAYAHVAMHALVDNRWIPLDPIVKDKPAGWEVPDATMRHVYGVNTPDGTKRSNGLAGLAGTVGDVMGTVLGIAALWFVFRRTLKRWSQS